LLQIRATLGSLLVQASQCPQQGEYGINMQTNKKTKQKRL
jgi:hypothetical protein